MFSVAVMAGGKSTRMGRDKSFVVVGGQRVIERVLTSVDGLGQVETFIVTNQPDDYAEFGLRMVDDVIPGKGSLGGIYTAVVHSPTDYVLVVACDMPFASRPLLRHMLALLNDGPYDIIVPRVEKYPQALHAIYGKACRGPIEASIAADQLKIIRFFGQVRVRYLDEDDYRPFDPHGRALFNLNTPDDLAEAERFWEEMTE